MAPKVWKKSSRERYVRIPLSQEELALCKRVAEYDGLPMTAWGRRLMLREAREVQTPKSARS